MPLVICDFSGGRYDDPVMETIAQPYGYYCKESFHIAGSSKHVSSDISKNKATNQKKHKPPSGSSENIFWQHQQCWLSHLFAS